MVRWWGKYFQKVHGKWKPFQKAHWKYYPVPGCMTHREILGEERGRRLFLKYVDYPQSAHGLYWRSHPAEYKKLLEIIDSRKSK